MAVSAHTGYPNLTYSPESAAPTKSASHLLQIAIVAGLGVALLLGVARRVDPEAIAAAGAAPLVQGD